MDVYIDLDSEEELMLKYYADRHNLSPEEAIKKAFF